MKPWEHYFAPILTQNCLTNLPTPELYLKKYFKKYLLILYYLYDYFTTVLYCLFIVVCVLNAREASNAFDMFVFIICATNYSATIINGLLLRLRRQKFDEFVTVYSEFIKHATPELDHHLNRWLATPRLIASGISWFALCISSSYFYKDFYVIFLQGRATAITSYCDSFNQYYQDNVHLARLFLLYAWFCNFGILWKYFSILNLVITLTSLQTGLFCYMKETSEGGGISPEEGKKGIYSVEWIQQHQVCLRLGGLLRSISSMPLFIIFFSWLLIGSIVGILFVQEDESITWGEKGACLSSILSFTLQMSVLCNAVEKLEDAHAAVVEESYDDGLMDKQRNQHYSFCHERCAKKLNFTIMNFAPVSNETLMALVKFVSSTLVAIIQIFQMKQKQKHEE